MNSLGNIKSIPPEQWIIWVGAGISNPAPTCLPLGKQLTEFTLKKACGKSEGEAILSIWDQVNKQLNVKDEYKNFSQVPRLESILDVISEVETKMININYSFMEGFRSFLEAPYNSLHVSLSILLSMGAKIITSNFDLCIEKAYNEIFNGKDILVPHKLDTLVIYKSSKNSNNGEIWHYHGTVDEIQKMGATLRIVKEGLSSNVKEKITELIQSSKVLIFVGYSFNDAFDINPFFENHIGKTFSDTFSVYFQHIPEEHLPKIIPSLDKITRLLQCFKYNQFDFGRTDEFLANLSGNNKTLEGKFEWERNFLNYAKLQRQDEISPFLICKLSNFLGIGVHKVSKTAYRNALIFRRNYPNDDFHDTMAVVLRRQGKFSLERKHHLMKQSVNKEKGYDSLGYYYGIGNFKEALAYAASIDEILEGVSNPRSLLNWRLYTSMAVHCRPIIQDYLWKMRRRNVRSEDVSIINNYLPILNTLGSRPLQNIVSINQAATALRFILLFKALLMGKDDIEIENRIFYLYGESSSIEGYVSTFRDIAIKYNFLSRFHKKGALIKEATHYSINSLRLAKLVGDNYGIERACLLLITIKLSYLGKFLL